MAWQHSRTEAFGPVGPAPETAARDVVERAQCITFAVGRDQYGVDILAVREIRGWSQARYLPGQPDYVRGVLNLRGRMVPIIDLRCRFGQGITEASALHVAIIVEIEGWPVGLLADRVLDIVAFDREAVHPIPPVIQGSRIAFLSGLVTVEGAMIALINPPNLVSMPSAQAA